STALVGVDGWGDARFGSPETTHVVLNDHLHITDLIAPSRAALIERVRALADDDASLLGALLDEALARFGRVIVATHVPPFAEACLYRGKVSDASWLPWFACKATGEVLLAKAAAHADKSICVLAGHMHERCTIRPLANLEVRVGAAEYGAPRVEDVIEIA
ncbi:MAG: phosphoesterase, partial [Sandaracinaceae bacterium]|nr:phosphoesterase [Sandaracinaceae bacterium]